MSTTPTLFRVLVHQRHWNKYVTFCGQYDKAAAKVERALIGTWPSRGQYHRWLSGQLVGLPYADHCRVLEHMFGTWTAAQLFAACPPELLSPAPAQTNTTPAHDRSAANGAAQHDGQFADMSAVFTSRSDFASAMPPDVLFDGAQSIRAAGLSLNVLCQQYPEQRLRRLIEGGARVHCLFLDPEGTAIQTREREEGHPAGLLAHLTTINISVLSQRIRDRLSPEARDRLTIAVYDETVRFNIVIADDTCVAQPYLPDARGVDSPTLVMRRQDHEAGLFTVFEQVFTSLAERSKPV